MVIESYGISDIGLSRSNNEDVWAELPQYNFYVLADGMGGHRAGEVAAKEAVMQICDSIDALFSGEEKISLEKATAGLKKAFFEANRWVLTLSQNHPELSGMGTTLCCLLLLDHTLIYGHVGDSRIYRFREKLTCLTQDHSQRQSSTYKTMLTRAVGTTSSVEPDIHTTKIQQGDIYFACSDGLTDYVSEPEIENILKKAASIKEACFELVEAAKTAGGNDNITLVVIRSYEKNLS